MSGPVPPFPLLAFMVCTVQIYTFRLFYNQGIYVTLLLKFALPHPKRKSKIKRTVVPGITVCATDQGHRLISLSSQLFVTLELFLKVLRSRM
jgi:hypothetical protein